MKLFRTKTFKKDYQKVKTNDKQYERYIQYLALMLDKKALPPEARDHPLVATIQVFENSTSGVIYFDHILC